MGNLNEVFVTNLKELLGDRSAYWLAKKAKMTEATLSRLLSGKSSPSLETVEKVAEGLGVPPHELLKESKKSDQKIPPDILAMLRSQDPIVYEAIRGMLRPLTR